MTDVGIFEVYIGEVTTYMWLCPGCVEGRAKGRGARPPKRLDQPDGFDGKCQDCTRDYRAPAAVDFVPTSPDARLPTREECPPPEPMKPWAKPTKRRTPALKAA